jgi:hypothetical protein
MAKKYQLASAQGVVDDKGKLSVPKGTKYQNLGTMVELPIKNGKRAGENFIVSELSEGVEKGSTDQFFATKYRGDVKGSSAPSFILTHRAAGAPADQSTMICSLFLKKYPNGEEVYVGRNGNTRFRLEDADIVAKRMASWAKKA